MLRRCAVLLAGAVVFTFTGCAPLVQGESRLGDLLPPGDDPAAGFGSAEEALAAARDAWTSYSRAEGSGEVEADLLATAESAGLAAAVLDPAAADGLLLAGRARVALAEVDGRDESAARTDLERAVRLARIAASRSPESAEPPYAEGIALGRLAELSGTRAAGSVDEIRDAFALAVERDPGMDRAGPLLALGLLYLRAPEWPAGLGDADLALEYLEEAVDRFPDHAPNRIGLAEALREVGERGWARARFGRGGRTRRIS
jgi:tetratricopeptide (TPR) repeat protein